MTEVSSKLAAPSNQVGASSSRLQIDLRRYTVKRDGKVVHLTRTEWALLLSLVRQSDRVLSHSDLLQEVWGEVYENESNYLYVYISRLRQKLEEDPANPKYLLTEPGIGYRWSTQLADNAITVFDSSALFTVLPGSESGLPAQSTSFIGRIKEVSAIQVLLQQEDVRLLTLTGPGGVGKTRLAVQVATDLNKSFVHGVHFVSLTLLADADLVIPAIAQRFGLKAARNEARLEKLKAFLADKHMLLILDNFEHLQPAATLIGELISAAPRVKVLVTSRERLHLYGENRFEVPPLMSHIQQELPMAKGDTYSEAVNLFVERAMLVNPGFAPTEDEVKIITQICVHLDSLPLAIELAASWSDLLSPTALLARLEDRLSLLTRGARDAPLRHHNLRTAINWSYDLLTTWEKKLFARLGVFVGGCTLEAVERICCTDDLAGIPPLEGLSRLVDKSLLRPEADTRSEPRFIMLETLREYALEHLKMTGEMEMLNWRHAEYYVGLVEVSKSQPAAQQDVWFDILDQDHGNLRAALKWSLDQRNIEFVLQICNGLNEFWWTRGYASEGYQWLCQALGYPTKVTEVVRAKALHHAGGLADWLGNPDEAAAFYKESLTLYRALKDRHDTVVVLNDLGLSKANKGEPAQAKIYCEESLALARSGGNKQTIAQCLNNLGIIALYQGDFAYARWLYDEQLSLSKELGNTQGIAWSKTGLSWVELSHGNYEQAHVLSESSLALHQERKDIPGIALSLTCLGWIALYQADFNHSIACLEASLALCQELGFTMLSVWSLVGLGATMLHQNKYVQARSFFETSLRLCEELKFPQMSAWTYIGLGKLALHEREIECAMISFEEAFKLCHRLGDKGTIASTLEGFAAISWIQNRPEMTVQLYGMAETLRVNYRLPLPPSERPHYQHTIAASRSLLDEEAWSKAWSKGINMTLDEVEEYILNAY